MQTRKTLSEPSRARRRHWAVAGVLGLIVAVGAVVWLVRDRSRTEAERLAVRQALAARRFDVARQILERWIDRRPGAGEPYHLLAKLEMAQDRPGPALEAMGRASALGYPAEPLNVLRAVLEARGGNYKNAEPILRRAFAEGHGPEPEVDEELARIFLADYRFAQAAEVIARWMKDAPGDPRPYLWRDQIDERLNAPGEDRIRNYREALNRDPSLAQARLGLADKLRELGRSDEAEAEYAVLLTRSPTLVEAHVGAGRNAQLRGDNPAAVRHFEEALRLNPRDPHVLRELALIDLRSRQYARARDRLETAVALDPYAPDVRYSYAQALKLSGAETQARQEMAITERLKAEHREMLEIRKALVNNPQDPGLRSSAAKWLLDHGHEPEALAWTQLVLRDHPRHPATCHLLASYYEKKGNTGLANYYRMVASTEQDPHSP
jgi:tetratricopeptide (TPR) repeat protein